MENAKYIFKYNYYKKAPRKCRLVSKKSRAIDYTIAQIRHAIGYTYISKFQWERTKIYAIEKRSDAIDFTIALDRSRILRDQHDYNYNSEHFR